MLAPGSCRSPGCGKTGVLCSHVCCRRWSSACCWCSWGSARTRRSARWLGHLPPVSQPTQQTFLALVIAEVYESAPYYYVLGAQAAFSPASSRGWNSSRAARRPPFLAGIQAGDAALAAPEGWPCPGHRMGQGDGRVRGGDHHRLPPGREYRCRYIHAAGDRPAHRAAIRSGPAGGRPAAAACRLHLERPCWTPTSRFDRRDFTVRVCL